MVVAQLISSIVVHLSAEGDGAAGDSHQSHDSVCASVRADSWGNGVSLQKEVVDQGGGQHPLSSALWQHGRCQ